MVRTLRGGEGFQRRSVTDTKAHREDHATRLVMALQSLDEENQLYTSASVSVSSLPGISSWSGTHRRVVGPGRALRNDHKWQVTCDRRSIAVSSDRLSDQIVNE